MTNTPNTEVPVKNEPVQLTQEDFIEFGEMQFINGEMANLEMVLSLRRDQLQFQARQGLIKRYNQLKATSRAMRAKFADLMTQAAPITPAPTEDSRITNPS